ncbi:hypothetical protein SmJEL517_g01015 [Synchytrium microbalum]|uniref:Uncharacterized protein n=1 Tax=Synchytrium microbalum TaxID=1806994 RepID=A0A507CBY9_9FUNG|nr:uncharacterized protein SmJEL517_g01015 [Synchytrium microbalum]TPX37132.1 hypothetical protein SmJEL517_g01015 [Synchytrium microbalum]
MAARMADDDEWETDSDDLDFIPQDVGDYDEEDEDDEDDDEQMFDEQQDDSGDDDPAIDPNGRYAQRIFDTISSLFARAVGNTSDDMDDEEDLPSKSQASPPRSPLSSSLQVLQTSPDARMYKVLRQRELQYHKVMPTNTSLAQRFMPDTTTSCIDRVESPVYTGKFSDDGSFFYACTREFMIHLYDTSRGDFVKVRSIQGEPGRWTITSCSLSPDNTSMAYSSITPFVYLAKVGQEGWRLDDDQVLLNFMRPSDRGNGFGIWSIRFSEDGRELVAGTSSASVYLYDVESKSVVTAIQAHRDDVNAVCFADASSNVVISGSDDTTCKVWDRRSLASTRDPTGVLVGHTEGITYVSSKGDGRQVLSNGKDQSMKLWDLRTMASASEYKDLARIDLTQNFDYRWMPYPRAKPLKHPADLSICTYRGHAVLKTLIRCDFSPPSNTDRKYVYTGSADGRVLIFSIDGELVSRMNVADAFNEQAPPVIQPQVAEGSSESEGVLRSRALRARNLIARRGQYRGLVTRDVAWHPTYPLLVSSSWAGEEEASDDISPDTQASSLRSSSSDRAETAQHHAALVEDDELKGRDAFDMDQSKGLETHSINYESMDDARYVVPTTDDPTLPVLTFRFWILSTVFVIIGATVGQFFYFRSATISLSLFFVILVSYPLGVGLSRVIPQGFVGGSKFCYWMNPGPFNVKEHTLIVIAASCGISVAYVIDVLSVQILYYKQDIGVVPSILLLWSTQCLGYGLAGLLRKWLVYPSQMVWPASLPYVQLMSTFHGGQANPILTRQRLTFFRNALIIFTIYQFIPGFIAPSLTSIAVLCLIGGGPSQRISRLLAQVGSGFNGAGVLTFSLDWSYAGALGPLVTPFWAMLNVVGSAVVFGRPAPFFSFFLPLASPEVILAWIIMPLLYRFTNLWKAQDFVNKGQAFSTTTFDEILSRYNISRVLIPESKTLNETAYQEYSQLYLSPFWALGYGTAFASLSATLVHVVLFHGKDIVERFREDKKEQNRDVHMRMMRVYPEVPSWVYLTVLIGMTALSIFIVEIWNVDLQLRWWGVLLSIGLAGIFVLPVGIIQAISNQSIGINVVTEMIIGFISPGQPIANILFKTYGYMTLSQALNLVSDLKLGVYMKIPPRAMFIGQFYGTTIGAVVNYGVMKFLLMSIPDIQNKANGLLVGDEQWNPRYSSIFYAASVIWGMIGPAKFFSQMYGVLYWFFLVGAMFPIPFAWLDRKYPNAGFNLIHWPIIFQSTVFIAQNGGNTIASAFIVAYVLMHYVRRHHPRWFYKYNYTLSAALDSASFLGNLMIYLFFTLTGVKFVNWGLNPDQKFWSSTEYCSTVKTFIEAPS